jgi:hypothetical protein
VKHGLAKVQPIDPNLMKNHFEIGDKQAPFEQGSSYNRDMKKFDADIYKQTTVNADAGRDKKSNWNFGSQENDWHTEAKIQ